MTSIGGPGGIDGPTGPGGPDRPSELPGTDDVGVDAPGPPSATGATGRTAQTARSVETAPTTETAVIDALAADLAAGRLTPREAIDRLIQATAGPDLGAAERAELRELLGDLIASDPHLGSLIGRI